jgi:coenzyme F420-reducing hydrogenase delta subunit
VKTELEAGGYRRGLKLEYIPSMAIFHCRWCLPDSEQVRHLLPREIAEQALVVRINCSARMESELALKALAGGYDGVLVIGCEIGECHYRTGNHLALKRLTLARDVFALAGIYPERLGALWVSPFDQEGIAVSIEEYIRELSSIGPFR